MSDPVLSDYDGDPVSDQSLRRVLRMIAEALRQIDDPQAVASKGFAQGFFAILSDQISAIEENPEEFHLLREDCVELSRIHAALVEHYYGKS